MAFDGISSPHRHQRSRGQRSWGQRSQSTIDVQPAPTNYVCARGEKGHSSGGTSWLNLKTNLPNLWQARPRCSCVLAHARWIILRLYLYNCLQQSVQQGGFLPWPWNCGGSDVVCWFQCHQSRHPGAAHVAQFFFFLKLIIISKLTSKNDVYVEFHVDCCVIEDR